VTSRTPDPAAEPRHATSDFGSLSELEGLRDLVRALRAGEIDGLVVDVGGGDEVLTLSGADRPYRQFVEGMAQGAATVSRDGIILSANPRLAALLATSREELVGVRVASLLVPSDVASLDRLLAPTSTAELRLRLRTRDERLVPVTVTSSLLELDDETAVCLIVSDETEHERAAEQLASSERWFRALVANSSDLIVVVDAEGRLTYANPACERLLGFTPDAMLARSMLDLVHPDDLTEFAERFGAALASPGMQPPIEFRFTTADGGWRVLESVSTNCLDDDAIAGLVINARDVTDANLVRDALADRERLLREAQRTTHVGHWRYRLADDQLEWLSDEVFTIHGLSKGDWGGTMAHYLDLVPADDRESVRRALSSAIATGSSTVEHRVRRPDGGIRHVRTICELVHETDGHVRIAGTYQDITEAVAISAALHERVKELTALASVSRIAHFVDDPQRLCELTAEALGTAMQAPHQGAVRVAIDGAEFDTAPFDAVHDGASGHVIVEGARRGVVRVGNLDDSIAILPEERALVETIAETLSLWLSKGAATAALEQANVELHELNDQLEESSRFKDDLLSMASHELRTPLTPILGFLEFLTDHGDPLSQQQQEIVEVLRRNAQRMLGLVENLLLAGRAVAGPLDAYTSDLTLADTVGRIVGELGPTFPTVASSVEGWHLHADGAHLHQALGNLLTNATKYGAPPITITASSHEPGWVTVEVADHGPGVPEEFVPQMWERFSQSDRGTTRVSRGVGLGLAIVRLLVEVDGGSIGYQPGNPSGAVFSIELPGYFDAPDGGGTPSGVTPVTDARRDVPAP
jgi:PAS domain S-box-containing protein